MKSIFEKAALLIRNAEALLITAGAGIGVDSGLPTFRGKSGLYTSTLGNNKQLGVEEWAIPWWIKNKPVEAWVFYGRRFNDFRDKDPHAGFQILNKWARSMPAGYFVYTSNIDGHFQKAGFSEDRLYECHGNINYIQCVNRCCDCIWRLEKLKFSILEDERIHGYLPTCESCGNIARPNVLLFDDSEWIKTRVWAQENNYKRWRTGLWKKRLVIIEIGAGVEIDTVRCESEAFPGALIRINPDHSEGPDGVTSLPCGALEALKGIDEYLLRI